MNLDEMYPSTWLKAEDIQGSAQFLIQAIAREEIGQGMDVRMENIITFGNFDKRWTLNRTNAEAIAMLYGKETDNWLDKYITLYVTPVQGPNGIKPGIRVDTRPAQANTNTPAAQPAQQRAQLPADDESISKATMDEITAEATAIWGKDCNADLNGIKNDVCRGVKWADITETQGKAVLAKLKKLREPIKRQSAPAFPVEDDFDDRDPFADA